MMSDGVEICDLCAKRILINAGRIVL